MYVHEIAYNLLHKINTHAFIYTEPFLTFSLHSLYHCETEWQKQIHFLLSLPVRDYKTYIAHGDRYCEIESSVCL